MRGCDLPGEAGVERLTVRVEPGNGDGCATGLELGDDGIECFDRRAIPDVGVAEVDLDVGLLVVVDRLGRLRWPPALLARRGLCPAPASVRGERWPNDGKSRVLLQRAAALVRSELAGFDDE